MRVDELLSILDAKFPFSLSESYDNVGLLIGNPEDQVTGIIISLNITSLTILEAVNSNCNVIISHHPLIFKPISNIIEDTAKGKLITDCIRQNINIIAMHTNIDKHSEGINYYLAERLKLQNVTALKIEQGTLFKLITFCPVDYAERVRIALFAEGAGSIGNYDSCSFNVEGFGTFKANQNSHPFVGEIGKIHSEKEIKIETVFPSHKKPAVIRALLKSHPYEEVAYDIIRLENQNDVCGLGVIGFLPYPMNVNDFLNYIKATLPVEVLRFNLNFTKEVFKIAICGGSGADLIQNAINLSADAMLTSDIGYHQFEIKDNAILLIDAGHFETEIIFKDVMKDFFSENNFNFAILFSEQERNYISYLF